MPKATVTSKGQITIPKAIRDRLGLGVGDTLEFTVDEKGRMVARPSGDREGVVGILREFVPEEAISVEQMNEVVRERAARGKRKRND